MTKSKRTNLILLGIVLLFVGRIAGSIGGGFFEGAFWMGGLVLIFVGCYVWTKLKGRHWAFMFWGLLAPIGLLGTSLLRDRSSEKK